MNYVITLKVVFIAIDFDRTIKSMHAYLVAAVNKYCIAIIKSINLKGLYGSIKQYKLLKAL